MAKTLFLVLVSLSLHGTVMAQTATDSSSSPPPASSTANTPSAQYTSSSIFQAAVLNSTNTFRHQHNASAVVWNETLASYAAKHAAACVFAHSSDNPNGENLAQGYPNVTTAIDAWGNERADYNYRSSGNDGNNFEKTGHFTQLVWKATTSTGCAVKDCASSNSDSMGNWLLVCEYYPPGNVVGAYQQQVQEQITTSGIDGNESSSSGTSSGDTSDEKHILNPDASSMNAFLKQAHDKHLGISSAASSTVAWSLMLKLLTLVVVSSFLRESLF